MRRLVGVLFAVGAIAFPGVVSAQPKGQPHVSFHHHKGLIASFLVSFIAK